MRDRLGYAVLEAGDGAEATNLLELTSRIDPLPRGVVLQDRIAVIFVMSCLLPPS